MRHLHARIQTAASAAPAAGSLAARAVRARLFVPS
jgi:hypothetical protein